MRAAAIVVRVPQPLVIPVRVGAHIRLWSRTHFYAAALGREGFEQAVAAVVWIVYFETGQVIERWDAELRAAGLRAGGLDGMT